MEKEYVEKQEKNFWKFIKSASKEAETAKEHVEELIALLSDRSEDELVAFEVNLRTQLKALNHPQILELGVILDSKFEKVGGRVKFAKKMNVNGFLYFRCWLVLQGKEVCEIALKDPEKIADCDVDIAKVRAEGLLQAAQQAFTSDDEDETILKAAHKFNKKLSYDNEEVLPDEGLDFENLDLKYPILTKTVVELD